MRHCLSCSGERLPHTQVTAYLRALTEHSRAGLKEAQYGCSETECKDGFLYGREVKFDSRVV